MTIKRLLRNVRRGFATREAPLYCCEPLEPRMLLTVFTIQGTPGNDVITLSSHTRLGVMTFVDYSINGGPTQSVRVLPTDSVFVDTGTGTDEVNVLSTVVGTTIQGDSATDDILNIGGGPNGLQGIFRSINVASTAALWGITADDSNDTTARTGTLNDGSLTGLAPANITWDPAKCTGLLIDTGSGGGNNLTVLQTNVQTTIQGHSTGADDSLVVGNPTDGLADITGHVTLGGTMPTTGLWHLTLDYQADHSNGFWRLDDGSIAAGPVSKNGVTSVNWTSSAVRDLTLKAPISPNIIYDVYVRNTDVPTTIIGDDPDLGVFVGEDNQSHMVGPNQLSFNYGVQGITSNIYLTDLAGSAGLSVVQYADPTPRTVTLHTISVPGDSGPWGAIDGLAPATIAYRYADTGAVSVGLGDGQSAPATVQVQETATSASIDGAGVVDVGEAGSIQKIVGPLTIKGGSVNIDDSADPVSRNVTVSLVNATGDISEVTPAVAVGGLNSGGIEVISPSPTADIDLGAGGNAVTINAPPLANPENKALPPLDVRVNTGSGNDAAQVLASAFGGTLTINGEGGDDAFTITYGSSLTDHVIINGGDGTNTLTLNGPNAIQFVNSPIDLTPGTVGFPLSPGYTVTTYSDIQTLALDTGTFTISGDLGGVNVNASLFATVKIQATTHLGTLNIGDGTQVVIAAGPTPLSETFFCTGLSIAGSGKLEVANNAVQLTYAGADPVATVRSYLTKGYDKGAWDGSGIITSAGDAAHALGLGDSADGIVAGLSADTILIRWTRSGDVNLDGKVGFADLIAVARNYGKTGLNWDQGDVNYDGAVGFDDLIAVARNYGASAAVQSASAMLAAAPLAMPIKTRKRR